jgi:hypothetical protein
MNMEPQIDVGYFIFGYCVSLWAIFMYLNYKKYQCMKSLRKIYSSDLKKLTEMSHVSELEIAMEKQG